MSTAFASPGLSAQQFDRIRQLLYRTAGIKLTTGKEELVRSRLNKRLRMLSVDDFDGYLALLEKDQSGEELKQMVDLLTTNKTSFFREAPHFEYLTQMIGAPGAPRTWRIWSAGCSTGEEPYTIAMVLRENLANAGDSRVLATDISARVLDRAKDAHYDDMSGISPQLLSKYFDAEGDKKTRSYRAKESLRGLITYARLNLMGNWPMKGPFDVIFCRNVMIYFDRPTQERLVGRYFELLRPGGVLFVGHSESLTGMNHGFRYAQPAVYVKP